MKNIRTARHLARQLVVQGLYQYFLANKPLKDIIAFAEDKPDFKHADQAHFKVLIEGIIADIEKLNHFISLYLDRSIAELSPIEHSVLVIGAYELQYKLDIPCRAILNECVELEKTFGGTDGYKYINGVLDKIAMQARPNEM